MPRMEEPAANGHHPTLSLEDLEERGPMPPPPSPMMLGLLGGDQEHLRRAHPNMQRLTEMVQRLATHMEEEEEDHSSLDLTRSPISPVESDQPKTPSDLGNESHAHITDPGEHAADPDLATTESPPEAERIDHDEAPGTLTASPMGPGPFWTSHQALLNLLHQISNNADVFGLLEVEVSGRSPSPDPYPPANGLSALAGSANQGGCSLSAATIPDLTPIDSHLPEQMPEPEPEQDSDPSGSFSLSPVSPASESSPASHSSLGRTRLAEIQASAEVAQQSSTQESGHPEDSSSELWISHVEHHNDIHHVGQSTAVQTEVLTEGPAIAGPSQQHRNNSPPLPLSCASGAEETSGNECTDAEMADNGQAHVEAVSTNPENGLPSKVGSTPAEAITGSQSDSQPSPTLSSSMPNMNTRPVSNEHALQAWLIRQQLIAGIPVDRLEPMMGPRSRQTQVTTEGILTRFRVPPMMAITRDGTRIPQIPPARFHGHMEPLPPLPWLSHESSSNGGLDPASTAPHVPSSEPINAPFVLPRQTGSELHVPADDGNEGPSQLTASARPAPAPQPLELSIGTSQVSQADAALNEIVDGCPYDMYGGDGAGDMPSASKSKGKQWAREPDHDFRYWTPTTREWAPWDIAAPTQPSPSSVTEPPEIEGNDPTSTSDSTPQSPPHKKKGKQWPRELEGSARRWTPSTREWNEWGMTAPAEAGTSTFTAPAEAEDHGPTGIRMSTQTPPPKHKKKWETWAPEPHDENHHPIPPWDMPSAPERQGENQSKKEQADIHDKISAAPYHFAPKVSRTVEVDLGTYFQLLPREQQLAQVQLELWLYFKGFPSDRLPNNGKRLYTKVSDADSSQDSDPGAPAPEHDGAVDTASKVEEPVSTPSKLLTPSIAVEHRAQNEAMAFTDPAMAPGDVESPGHSDWALSWGKTTTSQESKPSSLASDDVCSYKTFSLGKDLGRNPDLFAEITDYLELPDLEALTLVNRRFHCLIFRSMDRIKISQVEPDAAMTITARIFPWTHDRKYTCAIRLFWSASDKRIFAYRSIPRLRWFKMLRHMTAVAQDIFGFLDSGERRWPQRTFRVILKIALLMRLPDNGRRTWLVRHQGIWPEKDLQMAALVFSNLAHLIDQKDPPLGQLCSLPILMTAQRTMSVLRDYLRGDGPHHEVQVLQLIVRHCQELSWEWFGQHEQHPPEYGPIQEVIAAQLGDLPYDGTIRHLIHPNEIILQELRRRNYEISTPMALTEVEADTPGDELDWTVQLVQLVHVKVKFAASQA